MNARAPLQEPKPQAQLSGFNPRVRESSGSLRAQPPAFGAREVPNFCAVPLPGGRLLQRKLAVNQPGDSYEREADRTADLIMSNTPVDSAISARGGDLPDLQRDDDKKPKSDEEKYKEGAKKIGEAFLKTPLGKELKEKVMESSVVQAGQNFVGTLPGKIVVGAAAVGTVSALAATHSELPMQIPEIPLDVLLPGLSVQITYKGPVDKPSEASISFKFAEQAPKSGEKKPSLTRAEKQREENTRVAAENEKFRSHMHYPAGSPEAYREDSEKELIAKAAASLRKGPDVDATIKKYPYLQQPAAGTGVQLGVPPFAAGYKRPTLLGDELKLKPIDPTLLDSGKKKDATPVSRKATDSETVAAPAIVDEVLRSPGQPLDSSAREFMEARLGRDFSHVRVHTDARAARSAKAVHARAYTSGKDIVFAAGQYSPGSTEGKRLLGHELSHVIQQGEARATETRELRRQLTPASTDDARNFVADAISFLQTGGENYHVDIRVPGLKFDQAKFKRQLTGWKTSVENVQSVINSTLAKDAALTQNLKSAYANAVRAAVAFAADRLGRSAHSVYTEHRDEIADFALPQASLDAAAGELSDALPAGDRAKLTVITSGITFNVEDLFSTKTARTTIPLSEGVTAVFASGVPQKLRRGLTNVAGTIIPKPLVLNSTMTLALDLEAFGGDFGAYRFTYLERKLKGKAASRDVLIEHLGAAGMEGLTKAQAGAAQKKFDAHSFRRGAGWKDEDFATVLEAIAKVPDSILSPVDGITFNRGRVYDKEPAAGGNYNPDTHAITIFDLAFSTAAATRFQGAGGTVSSDTIRAVEHEIGHAVDLLPLRKADVVEKKRAAFKAAFARFENSPGSGNYNFPSTEQGRFNNLKAEITAAEQALTTARSESGERYQSDAGGTLTMVEGGTAAGSNEFRQAAVKDGGKRLTEYSKKEWQEYFAEAFSFYITDPATLKRLRPSVFRFFNTKYPR